MLEFLASALLLLAPSGSPLVQDDARTPMSPPGAVELPDDGVALPLVPGGRLPMVEVRVGEAGPFRFVVEWAGNVFAVSQDVREAAGLAQIARTPDGIPVVAVPELRFGEARFVDLVAEVPRFLSRVDHDGVLGLNVFRDVTATLDFPAGELRLEDAPLPGPDEDVHVLVHSPGPGGSPRVPITLGGRPFQAVLDTAAERLLILDDRFLPDLELVGEAAPGPPIRTPGGRLETLEGTIAGELVVGSVRLVEPRAVFHRMRGEPEALLGGEFLRDCVVRLDQRNRRVAVEVAGSQETGGEYRDVRALPEGPVGRRITELLETVNANDPERVTAFLEESCAPRFREFAPLETHQEAFAQIYRQSQGLEFVAVREYAVPGTGEYAPREGETVVILRNSLTEGWEALVVRLEPDPPHRIVGLNVSPARPPSDLPPPATRDVDEVLAELGAFLERVSTADVFSGTVLVARGGEVLFRGAYGPASRRFDVPNRLDTKFNLGSMNKMFTSVCILALVQRGELALDDTIERFVGPDWLPEEVASKIQVRHLLTHTSGLGSYFNDEFMRSSRTLFRELDDYKPLLAGEMSSFEPGTDWSYSNTGMFLLGVVIESVTGESYFDVVRETVYRPAGMTNSDSYDMDRPVPNLAIGYSREDRGDGLGWTNNLFQHVIRGGPAGGGFSTVEDLWRFARALSSYALLDVEHTELLWSPKPELGSPGYGYGFSVSGAAGDRVVGHGGGFAGISANLDAYLDRGFVVAVLSNVDGGAQVVNGKVRELLASVE